MKRILLILVGGTICTLSQGGVRSLATSEAQTLLVEHFRKSDSPFCGEDETEIISGKEFNTLSENMTVDIWNRLKEYFEEIPYEKFDGIIVAHGTDTLAYSASIFAILLAGIQVPVFFVSSNAPLVQEGSNGDANFQAAVECICCGIEPNVYVTYRNFTDGNMYIHLGAHLLQCRNYDESFYSRDMKEINSRGERENVSFGVTPNANYAERIKGKKLSKCVLKIDPYVGLDYSVYQYDYYKAVLHGTYHSGTLNTNTGDSNVLERAETMVETCEKKGVQIYISPAKDKPEDGGEIYESIVNVRDKVNFLYGMTSETAYTKLLIAYSCFSDTNQINEFLETEISGEFLYGRVCRLKE